MEEVENKKQINEIKKEINVKEVKEKKQFKIMGFTVTRLLAYFVLYSVLGFLIETTFGLITKGVIESRKSFLYGPFCGIYGLGAVIMILGLQRFKKNNYTLFFGGFFIGSVVEYAISLIGEIIFHIKWWDYSHAILNINGRICLVFSIFWGILAIYLIKHIQPKIDKFLDKFRPSYVKTITIVIFAFMMLDMLVTGFALKMFFTRLEKNYDLDIKGVEEYSEMYTRLYENPKIEKVVDKYFNDKVIMMTFPNIKITTNDGEIIWICDILKDVPTYYYKVFTPRIAR